MKVFHGAVAVARGVIRSPCSWLVAAAAVSYCLVGLSRQHNVLTAACDLGIFDQAVHGWAMRGFPEVPIKGPGFHHWGDHFMPLFALLAPLYWIWDAPQTLIIAGHVLLASSGIPVYRTVRRLLGDRPAVYLTAAYLTSFGLLNDVGYDVHETIFSATLLAWALERALAGRWSAACVFACATMLAKEDMGATVFMFGVLAMAYRKWRHALVLLLAGPLVLITTVRVIIPHFRGGAYPHYDYLGLGGSTNLEEFGRYVITHPAITAFTLFDNPTKLTTWGLLLVPFGLGALRSPVVLLTLPTLAERMLSTKPAMWAWTLYYSTVLMVILVIGMADGLARMRRRDDPAPTPDTTLVRGGLVRGGLVRVATSRWPELALAMVLLVAVSPATPLRSWLSGGTTRSASYRQAVQQAIAHVPTGVTVQVSNYLLPQIPRDNRAILIGEGKEDTSWAIIDVHSRTCSGRPEVNNLDGLRVQGFTDVYEQSGIIVLRRGP